MCSVIGVIEGDQMTVARRGARAILVDEQDRLVLIKRVKPGEEPYWTTPGGGIEEFDASPEAAMRRELAEELGAEAGSALGVFFTSTVEGNRVWTQHFFAARLRTLDERKRTGRELQDPSRGSYMVDRIALDGDDLAAVELRPRELREFLLANRASLVAELACLEE
jgi:ADP-ribose pyrophosphatase YjhB (NUDIX family)